MAAEEGAQEPPPLSGLILAAGLSRRMGRPKALLPLGERPLLAHVIEHARASCLQQLIVVLREPDENAVREALALDRPPRPRLVLNPEPERGQSHSLRLGLAAVDSDAVAVAVLLGDQPGVDATLIDRVADAFLAGSTPAARPVWKTPGGKEVPGHPVFLARRLFARFGELRGDEGGRALLARHPDWLLRIALLGPPPLDIDTWQDYQRLAALPRTGE